MSAINEHIKAIGEVQVIKAGARAYLDAIEGGAGMVEATKKGREASEGMKAAQVAHREDGEPLVLTDEEMAAYKGENQ